jgi:hypothetical protein
LHEKNGPHNHALAADRKKPRPLKSVVPGDCVAGNRGADFVQRRDCAEIMNREQKIDCWLRLASAATLFRIVSFLVGLFFGE